LSKLERLLNLIAALLASSVPLTAEQIQDRVTGYPTDRVAFRRMFERDKSDLREMGVPLKVLPNPEIDPPIDGYLIDSRDYAGIDVEFEPDELAALHLAANLVRIDGADEGLLKLGEGQADSGEQIGVIHFDNILATLVSAAASRRAVTFTYSGAERTVEPWRVSFAKGHWYLAGWDHLRDDDRLFRVDRLVGPVSDAGEAHHPIADTTDPGSLRGWELGDDAPVTAVVRVDADHAAWAHRVFGSVEEQADGSHECRVEVRNPPAFRSAVLTFLNHAEIISPPEFRSDMIEWLEAQL